MSTIDHPNLAEQASGTTNTRDTFGINVGEAVEQRLELAPAPEVFENGLICNVGRTEQKIRLAAGTALLATAAFAPLSRGWRIGLAALGAMELITGTLRYCPVSHALGINTCNEADT